MTEPIPAILFVFVFCDESEISSLLPRRSGSRATVAAADSAVMRASCVCNTLTVQSDALLSFDAPRVAVDEDYPDVPTPLLDAKGCNHCPDEVRLYYWRYAPTFDASPTVQLTPPARVSRTALPTPPRLSALPLPLALARWLNSI